MNTCRITGKISNCCQASCNHCWDFWERRCQHSKGKVTYFI